MIITEYYDTREDEVVLNITYSDRRMMIRHNDTGTLYESAIDPEEMHRTYTETDIPIEDEELAPEEALSIITGGIT